MAELDRNPSSLSPDSFCISLQTLVPVTSFVIQIGTKVVQDLQHKQKKEKDFNHNLAFINNLNACINAVKEKNIVSCIQNGCSGEGLGIKLLNENGAWLDSLHREYYNCCALTGSIGFAKKGNFLAAIELLDKVSIFGFQRNQIKEFYDYIEDHALSSCQCHNSKIKVATIMPDYQQLDLQDLIKTGLSSDILHPIHETNINQMTYPFFQTSFEKPGNPVVIRGYGLSWPAVQKWR